MPRSNKGRTRGLPHYFAGKTPECPATRSSPTPSGDDSEYDEDLSPVTRGDFQALINEMKELRSSVHTDVQTALHALKSDVADLGARTDHMEKRIEDVVIAQHSADTLLSTIRKELTDVQDHQEDLDNRARRNNLRIRGIPESVELHQLEPYLKRLFMQLAPDIQEQLFLMDRAHRALRPRSQDPNMTRDVILRLHYFSTKEAILKGARQLPTLSYEGSTLHIYQDLAPSTLAKRRTLKPVTSLLAANNIRYRWGFPFRLLVWHQNRQLSAINLQEAHNLIQQLGLSTPDAPGIAPHPPSTAPNLLPALSSPALPPREWSTPSRSNRPRPPNP